LFYDGADWDIQYQFELGQGGEGIVELNDISAADEDNVWLVGSGGI